MAKQSKLDIFIFFTIIMFCRSIVVTVPAYGNFEIEFVGICQCDCENNAVSTTCYHVHVLYYV